MIVGLILKQTVRRVDPIRSVGLVHSAKFPFSRISYLFIVRFSSKPRDLQDLSWSTTRKKCLELHLDSESENYGALRSSPHVRVILYYGLDKEHRRDI